MSGFQRPILLWALLAGLSLPAVTARSHEPAVQVMQQPADPARESVLIGQTFAADMFVLLRLLPATPLWTFAPGSSQWVEEQVDTAKPYHLDVKAIDPKTLNRIPYADVRIALANKDNKQRMEVDLPAMWGRTGLHYGANTALLADGIYDVTVTIGAPTFIRDRGSKDVWLEPARAKFHFRLVDWKVTEVSKRIAQPWHRR